VLKGVEYVRIYVLLEQYSTLVILNKRVIVIVDAVVKKLILIKVVE
jgi:hypothetical protein